MRTLSLIQIGALFAFVLCGCSSTAPRKPTKGDWQKEAEYQQLLQERADRASQLLQGERRKFDNGKSSLERVLSAAVRLRDARLELAAQPEIVIRAEYLSLMRELEDDETKRLGLPELVAPGIELTRYWRLSAEID